ncbi:serine protease [Rhizoctonia solani]|nr:serine protease [Rhizoctonia solani]
MRTAFVVSALAFIVPALSAPTVIPIAKRAGPVKPDSYVIKFKDGASHDVLAQLAEKLRTSDSSITHTYTVWPGFAAVLKGDSLEYVRKMPGIESMEEDSILSLCEHEIAAPGDMPPRVAKHYEALTSRGYLGAEGKGVTIYDIDTGVYTGHRCFGGRATVGKNWITGESDQDENGHGTHTAGTAACSEYGGAGGASVTALKVLNKEGSGSLSDVMDGVNWAFRDFKTGNKVAIATMSLGAQDVPGLQKSLDEAIQRAVQGGLHFTVAAGNSNMDAATFTPARVKEANTVGAVDDKNNNQKASFSNWGNLIDVWAPGVNIKSAWIGSPSAENTISGTSMATPYVAGVLAAALGKYGQMSPADLSKALQEHASKTVTFSPADTLAEQSSNKLFAEKW